MKKTLLVAPILFAFLLTGCSFDINSSKPAEEKPVEQQPTNNQPQGDNGNNNNGEQNNNNNNDNNNQNNGETTGDNNNNTTPAKEYDPLTELLFKAYQNYTDPSIIHSIGVNATLSDLEFGLHFDSYDETNFGKNVIDLSLSDINGKVDAYVNLSEEQEVSAVVNASEITGKVALEAGLLQPKTQVDENNPEGYFVSGEFDIAESTLNAYVKDGNAYIDYSDDGIRQTLTNAGELAAAVMDTGMTVYSIVKAKIDDMNKKAMISRDPEPEPDPVPSLDLNALLDAYTNAPDRKIYSPIEDDDDEQDIDEEAITEEAPTEEEIKDQIEDFVVKTLPTLKFLRLISVEKQSNGDYDFAASLDKDKTYMLISMIQYSQESGEGGDIDNDIDYAALFYKYVDKFDVDLSLTLDKEGFVKSLGVEYDIEASMEKEQIPYVGESNASISLAGEVNASFKYNDAVSLVFPNDLDTYVLFEF